VSAHPLAGPFSVEASARRIRHYRYAEERMMRTLGGWIALSPEVPVKLLFGRHVWECAQHADRWGRRLPELRAPAQQSEPTNDAFVSFMDLLESPEARGQSVERVVGVYRVLKPHLAATYEAHHEAANPIYEPPTRRILERCAAEERRHVVEASVVLDRLLGDAIARARAAAWEQRLLAALAGAGGVTGATPAPPRSFEAPGAAHAGPAAPDSAFDPSVIAGDLRHEIEAHAAAIVSGDPVRVAAHVAGDEVLAAYRSLAPASSWEIVGQAKVGAHRFVKLRLTGPERVEVVQQQWRRLDAGWRVVEAEIVRVAPTA
jgi:hypothetical protein